MGYSCTYCGSQGIYADKPLHTTYYGCQTCNKSVTMGVKCVSCGCNVSGVIKVKGLLFYGS